jgi:hypothetical protein
MPEISLFLDRDDELRLVTLILSQGERFVADLQSSPDYQILSDLDEFMSARKNDRLFFILFGSYVESPLKLTYIREGHFAGKYSVIRIRPRNYTLSAGSKTVGFRCISRTDE